jgi:hypothetical protein
MRIQHVAQAVKDWPDNSNGERREGASFADAVEHIRWRLWHDQVERALDLIGDTVTARRRYVVVVHDCEQSDRSLA